MKTKIEVEPFSWNEPMAELAIDDFKSIRIKIPYPAMQSIDMALAKLDILEKQGAKVVSE